MSIIRFNSNFDNIEIQIFGSWNYNEIIPLNVDFPIESDGYSFEGVPDEGYLIANIEGLDSDGFPVDFLRIEDNEIVGYKNIDGSTDYTIDITLEKNFEPPIREVSGFNKVYLVTNETLSKLSKERFIAGGGGTGEEKYDLGQFIINTLELPFPVPIDLLGDIEKIILGSTRMETETTEILSDSIVLDMGVISVPHKYNNSFDYVDTEIKLHLPYVDSIDIEIEYSIGYDISIQYIIDLYSGENTVNITSSKTGKIIHSKKYKLGRNIPFITSNNRQQGSITDNSGLNNGVDTAFIEVIRSVPSGLNEFNDKILAQSNLKGVTGYVVIQNIILNTIATMSEKNMILNILKSGVFIR